MNIREALLAEHTKENATHIAKYACLNEKNFAELMQCFTSKEYRVAQRAAWSVSIAARLRPDLIQPHISTLVAAMQDTHVHNAVVRNSVRILQEIEIPEQLQGEVMNACFRFLEAPETMVAIKAFSLTTLYNLSKIYPEIKHELKLIIEANFEHETAAFKSRATKILAKF